MTRELSKDKRAVRQRDRNVRLRREVIVGYGGKCACCDEGREEFLAVDHVEGLTRGDPAHFLPGGKRRGGVKLYAWLVRDGFPTGYRLLCHNCNLSRGFYGYCPHEREPPRGHAVRPDAHDSPR